MVLFPGKHAHGCSLRKLHSQKYNTNNMISLFHMSWDTQQYTLNNEHCSQNAGWHIPASTCNDRHAKETKAMNHTHIGTFTNQCSYAIMHPSDSSAHEGKTTTTHTGSEAKNHTHPHRRIYGFINSNSTVYPLPTFNQWKQMCGHPNPMHTQNDLNPQTNLTVKWNKILFCSLKHTAGGIITSSTYHTSLVLH